MHAAADPQVKPPLPPIAPDARATDEDWWRRLHAYAVATTAFVEPGEVWEAAAPHLAGLLSVDAAAVVTPSLPEGAVWPAGDAAAEGLRRAAAAGDAAAVDPPGGPALATLSAPLLEADGAASGVLRVGWRGAPPEGAAARLAAVAQQLAAGLANARRYAEVVEASRQRDRFFSAMSHDLRTPITAIVGYSELLADGVVGDLNPQQAEMVLRISRLAAEFAQLVSDVLDLARLDAGRTTYALEVEPLAPLVADAVETVAPRADRRATRIRAEADPALAVRGDPARLRQILTTLLSNAVACTAEGEVTIRAGEEDGQAWVEVRDAGPALAAGAEEAVFDAFHRNAAGPLARRDPATRLGLAVARRLARGMGGDLVARNRPEGGAGFTLYLPLGDADGTGTGPP